MFRSLSSRLRWPLLSAAAAALILATTPLAGSGVGGVFNLGQVNTVDVQTSLTGNPGANPQLKVVNSGSAAAIRAETNSADPNSAGVVGKNSGGGTGLKAIVNAGVPPLVVNSSAKVLNLNADLLDGLDSTSFWKLGGNAGTTPGADFLGTTDNKALEFKVNGQRGLRIEPAARANAPKSPNLIGGFSGNAVLAGAVGATIAGGGSDANANLVSDDDGTVGGGIDNVAGDQVVDADPTSARYATVGGGSGNTASGPFSFVGGGGGNTGITPYSAVAGGLGNTAGGALIAFFSFVGGGYDNTASGRGSTVAGGDHNTASGYRSTVAGGYTNTAGGAYSTVGGGADNTASGSGTTVAGGANNTASGTLSFAAGLRAKATQPGSFVWGDHSTDDSITSPAANTVTMRAAGGIWLGTTSTPSITAGHFIDTSTGGFLTSTGVWTNASDRALKHDLRPLKTKDVLDNVARMPITSWSYKTEQPGVRHIGPMAQDFYKAFGLGLDDKHITTIDEGGVALAAIQGLYRQNQALRAQLKAQNARLTKLERAFSALSP
jgi:trimeric autotransporter adhesin